MSYDPTKASKTGIAPKNIDDAVQMGLSTKIDEIGVETVNAIVKLAPEDYKTIAKTLVRGKTTLKAFPHCTLMGFGAEFLATGMVEFTLEFIGLNPGASQGKYSWPANQIGCASGTEPIETHPEFIAKIGGTQGTPKNNSQWDKNGSFEGFPQLSITGKPNRKAGVRQYYKTSVTLRGHVFVSDAEQAGAMCSSNGKIVQTGKDIGGVNIWKDSLGRDWGAISHDKSKKSATEPPKPRDWLMIRCDAEQYGTLIRLNYELVLSEIGGYWDYDMYEDA